MSDRKPHYIREWRQKRRLSLRALANRMEKEPGGDLLISYASLGRIETGEQPFSEPILNALADALDVPRTWLLERNPEKEGAVVDLMRRLDERDLQRIIEMMEVMARTKATT